MEHNEDRTLYHTFLHAIRLHYHRTFTLLEKDGIYPGQPPLLRMLYTTNGQSQKELAKKLNIKPATLTVMLKRLEKTGFIEKKHDEKDLRISRVYLTDKGTEAYYKVDKTLKQIENECFLNFSKEEKVIFRRLLMQMENNLEINRKG